MNLVYAGRLILAASILTVLPTAAETKLGGSLTSGSAIASSELSAGSSETDPRPLTNLQLMMMVHQLDSAKPVPRAFISSANPACCDTGHWGN